MRLGVYVGSFNPVHKGHISICNYLLDNDYVDKIMLIPTLDYWDKHDLLDINDREAMLQMYSSNKIIVDASLSKYKYTYQILDELSIKYDDLYLIIGADNIPLFYKWMCVDKILNHHVIVLPRNNISIDNYTNNYDKKDMFINVLGFMKKDISSSKIRECILNNNYDELVKYLDDEIIEYIKKSNLYKRV